MSVVATSVFLLFALIVLGFILGKRNIIHKESIPDLSALVLQVTMPVTVFCSIIDQERSQLVSYGVQTFLYYSFAFVFYCGSDSDSCGKVQDLEQGVWIYSMLFSNNGFMGIPLALSVFGGKGMFLMALGNVVGNFLIFSVGVKLLTWKYPMKEKLNIRKMIWNNINIAVLLGLVVCILQIPVPDVLGQLLAYLSNITSGLSMLVVGLSISRLPMKAVFQDWKMLFLTLTRLLIFPLLMIGFLRLLPIDLDETLKNVLILTAALPVSSAQSMITEQYGTNTAAAGRSVFMTTLFSVITVPLIMMIAFA
ncbi:MAG: AEC family transporter [Eubacterium sp.]